MTAPNDVYVIKKRRSKFRVALRAVVCLLLIIVAVSGGYYWWTYHGPQRSIEIYKGISYGCEEITPVPEARGLIYWAKADLNVPGVSLYVTPLDPVAQGQGYEYRLRYVSTTVREENLAAAVNGTMFDSNSSIIRMSGDLARSIETTVSDHTVNHVNEYSYLLGWDENNVAEQELDKPPSKSGMARAKIGIATQNVTLRNGKVFLSAGHDVDHRTMIAVDPEKKLVWIAVFDHASVAFGANWLAQQGAKFGFAVDGGTSSAMAIGKDAVGVQSGTVTGNWRPVATQFGFRAEPISK